VSLFLSVEGVDGIGKSTQAERLVARLRAEGRAVLLTREPGGTALGAEIRELLLDKWDVPLYPEAEVYLYAADRAQHVREVLQPALQQGYIVVSDRYIDSSVAYQSAQGLPAEVVWAVNELATGGLVPDLTFWLDAEVGHRADHDDRVEGRGASYRRRVREGFRALWRTYPDRIARIDAAGTPEEVAERIYRELTNRLGARL
jgi:dTMP kinase